MKRTKIVCTIGPSVNSLEMVLALIKAGMDVARLNFSHGEQSKHLETLNMLKEARKISSRPLAILLDTKGPEVRVGELQSGILELRKGQRYWLVSEDQADGPDKIPVKPGSVLKNMEEGMDVLFNDGYISSKVLQSSEQGVLVEINNYGELKSSKSVNVPNARLDLPAMTKQDISDIEFACEQDLDIIAASFIRSAHHLMEIRKLLKSCGKPEIKILAKIENAEGVQNFDSILRVSDGIMVARGDMGVELPLSEVPRLQKMMIRKTYLSGKISVTATQMLESMIHCPRPTRAEVSDVANAIYDSSCAVMLSGETAIGKYPIETVEMMNQIIQQSEKHFDFIEFFNRYLEQTYKHVPFSVTLATVKTAYSASATAIFALTSSGATAQLLARLRPKMPIIAFTPNAKSFHQMALNWGVQPVLDTQNCTSIGQAFEVSSQAALKENYVQYGDLVVLTAGRPFGVVGTTNTMIVENIGQVLLRGHAGKGKRIQGKVCLLLSPEGTDYQKAKDKILVIPKCNYMYLPFFMGALGVILENHIEDDESEQHVLKCAEELNIPVLVRADGAFSALSDDLEITLDPEHKLVFQGSINE